MDWKEIYLQLRWLVIGWTDHVMNWWLYVGGPLAVILGAVIGWGLRDIRCSREKQP